MGRMSVAVGLVGALLVVLAGCGEHATKDDAQPVQDDDASPDAARLDANAVCPAINRVAFGSTQEHACNVYADGGVYFCTWWVSFDSGEYEYASEDTVESGTYWCEGSTIFGRPEYTDAWLYEGTYDSDTGLLIWAGREYAAAK